MKIELDLPQVPEGWRFVGYQVPDYKQGIIGTTGEFEVVNYNTCEEHYLTFERIEPEIDVELERARKKFPVGSWFKLLNLDMVQQVSDVIRRGADLLILCTNGLTEFVQNCTPFPLPTWRCCDSDKPKKEGTYHTRVKKGEAPVGKKKDAHYFLSVSEGWNVSADTNMSMREWLDEGEL